MVMAEKVRLEGLTLSVEDVGRSIDYYAGKVGLALEQDARPMFALIRAGGPGGGTIGLLSTVIARKEGIPDSSPEQKRAIHVELSTDHLDGLYEELKGRGSRSTSPRTTSRGSGACRRSIPTATRWRSRRGDAASQRGDRHGLASA